MCSVARPWNVYLERDLTRKEGMGGRGGEIFYVFHANVYHGFERCPVHVLVHMI